MKHRRIARLVECPEPRCEGPDTLIPVYLQVENLDHQRVPWLRAVQIKGSRQRVVTFDGAQLVPALLQGVAKRVEGIRLDRVARLHMCDWRRRAVQKLHIVYRGVIFNHVGRLRPGGKRTPEQHEGCFHDLLNLTDKSEERLPPSRKIRAEAGSSQAARFQKPV